MNEIEQPKSFLQSWMYYNSGDECAPEFHLWSGLALLGAVLGRKVWIKHGVEYFTVWPNIYVCLIGQSGSGKSTAKGRVKNCVHQNFPGYPISASIQSREDILMKMAASDAVRSIKVPNVARCMEYRPYFLIVNELKNFLSVAPEKMIDFLVDIYDEDYFSTGFKTAASQVFENPYMSVLACATPEWFMSNLKVDLFTGGLGRRLLIVHKERQKTIPNPAPPQGFMEVKAKAIAHLKEVYKESTYGEVKRTPEAMEYWEQIYREMKQVRNDDQILKQFYETKPIQVLKIALILSFDQQPFTFKCERHHLETAYAMINGLEADVRKLTAGIGTNVMAGVAAQMETFIQSYKGCIRAKVLYAQFFRQSPMGAKGYQEALDFLIKTGKLIPFTHVDKANSVAFDYLATPDVYSVYTKTKQLP